MPAIRFEVLHRDAHSHARLGRLHTPHGSVETPLFMPVGTRASVKGLLPAQLRRAGTEMLLANTYHLALRPGAEVVAVMGGLHRFMAWDGPILTDSGGYQVFSLAQLNQVDDDGVTFKSHVDGTVLRLDPESAVQIQEQLGADVIMAFDQCPALPAPPAKIDEAVDRTIHWARRCRDAQTRTDQALFGINQGGLDVDCRMRCMDQLVKIGFPGYAIGGLSVGEDKNETARVLDAFAWRMPEECPRYLMGVGRPLDMVRAVASGVDMFDCVLPTRNGRNAFAFTDDGYLRLRNAQYKLDERPLLEGCDCHACAHFSRAYLRHLFLADEMLGPILVSLHNIAYYQRWMRRIRRAIAQDRLSAMLAESGQAADQSSDSEDTSC